MYIRSTICDRRSTIYDRRSTFFYTNSMHKILIVDDETQVCRMVAKYLEAKGFAAFMGPLMGPGAVDQQLKELLALYVSLKNRCQY